MSHIPEAFTKQFCYDRVAECRALASIEKSGEVQIMLDHIAETWLRIANHLKS
jgi:hypothetical protein